MVNKCPKNLTEVYVASKRLGCGNDKYNNNQYMCLPNKEKNSLVEICYNGTMGKEDAGSCLEVTVDGFFRYNCSGFLSGCPNDTFLKSEIHNYPACQNINTQRHCYNMEPSCQAKSPSEDMDFPSAIFYVFLVIGAIVFLRSAIGIVRRKRQSKTVQTSGNESKGISSKDLLMNGFEEINGENVRENVTENNGGSKNEARAISEDDKCMPKAETQRTDNEELTSAYIRRTDTEDIRRTVAEGDRLPGSINFSSKSGNNSSNLLINDCKAISADTEKTESAESRRTVTGDSRRTDTEDSRRTDTEADTRRRDNEGDKLSGSLTFSSRTGNSSSNLLINDCKDISSIELETDMSSVSNKSTLKISINKDAQSKKNTLQSTEGLQ